MSDVLFRSPGCCTVRLDTTITFGEEVNELIASISPTSGEITLTRMFASLPPQSFQITGKDLEALSGAVEAYKRWRLHREVLLDSVTPLASAHGLMISESVGKMGTEYAIHRDAPDDFGIIWEHVAPEDLLEQVHDAIARVKAPSPSGIIFTVELDTATLCYRAKWLLPRDTEPQWFHGQRPTGPRSEEEARLSVLRVEPTAVYISPEAFEQECKIRTSRLELLCVLGSEQDVISSACQEAA